MRTTIFLDTFDGISPYLGGGLGLAFAVVSGLHFSSEYEDTSGDAPAYNPPRSSYNSRQDADLSDTVLAGHLHNGVDYSLNDKTLVGLKLTYSMMGNIDASGRYSLHPFNERDPRSPQPQCVFRRAFLDADADSQAPVRQLKWSIGSQADCLLHDLFRLSSAVAQSCNTIASTVSSTMRA